jgi:hypothetical protein
MKRRVVWNVIQDAAKYVVVGQFENGSCGSQYDRAILKKLKVDLRSAVYKDCASNINANVTVVERAV